MKIFAPCGFTYRNQGDALLLTSLQKALVDRFGAGTDISFSSFTPSEDSAHYGALVGPQPLSHLRRLYPRVPPPLRSLFPALAVVETLVFFVLLRVLGPRICARLPFPRSWRFVCSNAADAEVTVGVPGGYLMAPTATDWYWLSHACTLIASAASGKPTILSPCSIGPFARPYAPVAKFVLSRVDLIVVRERESRSQLRRLGVSDEKILVGADMAFYSRTPHARLEQNAVPVIGVSVRAHAFPNLPDQEALWNKYLDSVAAAVDWAEAELGAKVVFVPQCTGSGGDDPAVSRAVVQRCRPGSSAEVMESTVDVDSLRRLYAGFDLLLGTRMHANLIALTQAVPVVAIAYEHKTHGIMAQLGLDEFVVDIAGVSPGALVALVSDAWQRREELRKSLQDEIIPRAAAEAEEWLEYLGPSRPLLIGS